MQELWEHPPVKKSYGNYSNSLPFVTVSGYWINLFDLDINQIWYKIYDNLNTKEYLWQRIGEPWN